MSRLDNQITITLFCTIYNWRIPIYIKLKFVVFLLWTELLFLYPILYPSIPSNFYFLGNFLAWYDPLLLFHVGGSEAATGSPRAIKRDFWTLGQLVRGSGAQLAFSSILPVVGSDTGRNRQTQPINTWLHVWCHWQNFSFFDNRMVYMARGLLVLDGILLLKEEEEGLPSWGSRAAWSRGMYSQSLLTPAAGGIVLVGSHPAVGLQSPWQLLEK